MGNIGASEIITKEPLYKRFELSSLDYSEIIEIIFYEGFVDCFCPYCGKSSIFSGKLDVNQQQEKVNTQFSLSSFPGGGGGTVKIFQKPELYSLNFYCSRHTNHILNVVYKIENGSLTKIGQSPSLFEIQRGVFKKYKTVLGENYNDLYNSIMFYSSHFGVAAFAHLRRILENYFMRMAHEQCKKESNWNEKQFREARFIEKLELLKNNLPETLIQNPRIYSIISKGIHELSEEECLLYFEAVKECVFLCLDDTIEENRRIKSKENIKTELSRIDNKLNNK